MIGGADRLALDGVSDSLGAAVVGQTERHRRVLGGGRCVGDANSLIGEEVEELILLDGPAERRAELIAIQEGTFVAMAGDAL